MADIKTHLRELSVATTIGLICKNTPFTLEELYNSSQFFKYAEDVISSNLQSAKTLCTTVTFTGDLKQIVNNGYNLGKAICENKHFNISSSDKITWLGNNTQKDDPIDITVGNYGFSLKEESFILENMGLYKLLNCYTGSKYKKRHIFSDYARTEYEAWFSVTWTELITYLNNNNNNWNFENTKNHKKAVITKDDHNISLEFFKNGSLIAKSILNVDSTLKDFESKTTAKTREEVFSKFINKNLDRNDNYNDTKKLCAIAATKALANELNSNLNYSAGLPRFLRIHSSEYYYAKTTATGLHIYKVPALQAFGNDIVIESIVSSVPDKQANILTTIKNIKNGNKLVLRNECRFSHGQFNGTPEAKMYYEQGGSLLVIYESI